MVVKKPKPLLIIMMIMAFILIVGGIGYIYLTSAVNAFDKTDVEVIIPNGTSTTKIAKILKDKELIKSEMLFAVKVKFIGKATLKASSYKLNKSMNLNKIISVLSDGNGYNPDVINLTFKEGQRITDYAKLIANSTNNTYEDVISTVNDKNYISQLIKKYWFLTDEILTDEIYYPLEGYLTPDTYQFKNSKVSVEDIIGTILDETDKKLGKYKDAMGNKVHSYITMASMVELEGTNTKNRKMIVGVFNNRLNTGMNLGSDVTTYYALQYPMTSDLTSAQFATINPYNTRASNMVGKMPIGPICNPSNSSIMASVNPTDSDYLYFVADKKGYIYYTKTYAEHEKKVAEIKENGDWIW